MISNSLLLLPCAVRLLSSSSSSLTVVDVVIVLCNDGWACGAHVPICSLWTFKMKTVKGTHHHLTMYSICILAVQAKESTHTTTLLPVPDNTSKCAHAHNSARQSDEYMQTHTHTHAFSVRTGPYVYSFWNVFARSIRCYFFGARQCARRLYRRRWIYKYVYVRASACDSLVSHSYECVFESILTVVQVLVRFTQLWECVWVFVCVCARALECRAILRIQAPPIFMLCLIFVSLSTRQWHYLAPCGNLQPLFCWFDSSAICCALNFVSVHVEWAVRNATGNASNIQEKEKCHIRGLFAKVIDRRHVWAPWQNSTPYPPPMIANFSNLSSRPMILLWEACNSLNPNKRPNHSSD